MTRGKRPRAPATSGRPEATGSASTGATAPALPRAALLIGLGAVIYGVIAALREAWLCDDAFISFRYAENLVHGLGLVYNAGERVEGYSNFLWTLWIAAGMRLGASPETWSVVWGVICYAATLALLVWNRARVHRWLGGLSPALPVAAALGAAHLDWNIYATSGLETSLFTLMVTLAYVLAVDPRLGSRGAAGAGIAIGIAALVRPDGFVLAPVFAAWLFAFRRPGWRAAAAFAAAFAIVWAPYVIWKIGYYGDFFPNTYYAKSAARAWFSQGWIYVRLYFLKYGALLLGVPLAAAALAIRVGDDARRQWLAEVVLAAGVTVLFTVYVMRVGGDFMFARMLIPVAPCALILLELALARIGTARPQIEALGAAVALVAIVALPHPIPPGGQVSGVFNEREVYSAAVLKKTREEGRTLWHFFEDHEVRLAFVGSQAALAYYARPAVAIECQTGLTDRWIAHQPLGQRGRVGHEKVAPASYVIDQRRVHFTLHHFPGEIMKLDEAIPLVAISFAGIPARIIRWDPEMLAEMARRGAHIDDFPATLDRYIAAMRGYPDAQVRADYAKFERFYFRWTKDPAREAAFRARLGAGTVTP